MVRSTVPGQSPVPLIHRYPRRIAAKSALDIIADYDLVADGTDNFPTRYLVNDACVLLGKPNVYASIFRFDGQVSVFNRLRADGSRGPNYRDLFPTPPPPGLVPSCSEGGVIGVLPGIVGALQANEVLKVISGYGEPLDGRLLMVDAASMEFRTLKLYPNPENPLTGENPTQKGLVDYAEFCGIPLPQQEEAAQPMTESDVPGITPQALAEALAGPEPPMLVDVREPYEYAIAHMEGRLIPVGEVEQRVDEIPRDRTVVLHCRSGKRSADALRLLRDQYGYNKLLNLEGGILTWAREQDAGMAVY